MEVQNITVEKFNDFLENLRKLNPTLEKKYEDENFTIYKIKVNKKSGLFITSEESYIELRLENSLDNFSELKTELEELLKLAENPGDGNNPGGEGGPKQKFARNIAAIETLFKLESENRNATTEEQEILSNYVGWGGLADAFDPDKGNWAKEYQTLKNLLAAAYSSSESRFFSV